MRRVAMLALSAAFISAFSGAAMAYQSGTIYVTTDGEWMCIDRWGNEIPASASGGWTVVTPPRKVGGDCNNRRAVILGTSFEAAPADLAVPLLEGPVTGATKSISEKGLK